jgi:hypothetical protein
MGGPTNSHAAADMALEFVGANKTPHPVTKCFRQGGAESFTAEYYLSSPPQSNIIYYPLNKRKCSFSYFAFSVFCYLSKLVLLFPVRRVAPLK